MKPSRRFLKAIQWFGLALCLLLLVVWIASIWVGVHYWSPSGDGLDIGEGCVSVGRTNVSYGPNAGWSLRTMPPTLSWQYSSGPVGRGGSFMRIPLWMPLGIIGLLTILGFRFGAADPLKVCSKCGYDRHGLPPSAPCPECGAPPP